jgi:hypothetical protein
VVVTVVPGGDEIREVAEEWLDGFGAESRGFGEGVDKFESVDVALVEDDGSGRVARNNGGWVAEELGGRTVEGVDSAREGEEERRREAVALPEVVVLDTSRTGKGEKEAARRKVSIEREKRRESQTHVLLLHTVTHPTLLPLAVLRPMIFQHNPPTKTEP